MIPTRLASSSASSRYCVVRKTVVPSALSRATSRQIALRLTGSSPVVGSSRDRVRGSWTRARPRAEAPRHTARVGPPPATGGPGKADAVEQDVPSAPPLDGGEPVERGLEADQLAAGHQRIERGLLERAADRPPHLLRVGDDVVSGD